MRSAEERPERSRAARARPSIGWADASQASADGLRAELAAARGLGPLVEALRACFDAPDYRPPILSPILTRIVALARSADPTLERIVEVLADDGLVAAHVQTVATREGHASGIKVSSLRQAVLCLGLVGVHDVVIELVLDRCVFRSEPHPEPMARLRRHSIATAHLARSIAEVTPVEGGLAFAAGLLHDVGLAGAIRLIGETAERHGLAADPDTVWRAIEQVHPHAGLVMARHWDLPGELQVALAGHHDGSVAGPFLSPLAAVLALANELAHVEGFGLVEPGSGQGEAEAPSALDRTDVAALDRASDALALDLRARILVAHRAQRTLEQLPQPI